jgi:serine/threonine protein kinase
MLSRGDMVKDYEVIAPLRSGGMALLFLARRRGVGGFNRLVVLKLVHPDLVENAQMTTLFLSEARVCAQIAHPNVVHVEEIGELDGTYFLAMEYVHGVSLAELIALLSERRLRMNPKLCIWIAAQIAEALHAVHEARGDNDKPLRIVHRDVSPQNVLVGHTGHVKLIDFGIAKCHHGDDPTALGSTVLGKLGYMAPEQLCLAPVDRRTDVYALGVMLWEMLTARSLFRCRRIDDERDWATRENPPPPSTFSPVSEAIDRVVKRAIEANPDGRFSSALAFRAALLRAEPDALKVDAPRLASLMYSLFGDELRRRREDLPVDVGAQLELESTAKPLGIEEFTAEVPLDASGEYDLPTRVREAASLFDHDATVLAEDDTHVSALGTFDTQEEDPIITLPQAPHARRASSGGAASSPPPAPMQVLARDEPPKRMEAGTITIAPLPIAWPMPLRQPLALVIPATEASLVTAPEVVPSVRLRRRKLSTGAVGLLSLSMLYIALGMVLGTRMQGEPAGAVGKLLRGAAFHAPTDQLTASQPEPTLRSRRALKRELTLASRDAGLQQARVHRSYKQASRAKLGAHARRSKR